jgi:hypothetical protein
MDALSFQIRGRINPAIRLCAFCVKKRGSGFAYHRDLRCILAFRLANCLGNGHPGNLPIFDHGVASPNGSQMMRARTSEGLGAEHLSGEQPNVVDCLLMRERAGTSHHQEIAQSTAIVAKIGELIVDLIPRAAEHNGRIDQFLQPAPAFPLDGTQK